MPMVAEPQPTRMRCSVTPSTTGARPAWTVTVAPSSIGELDRLAVAEREQGGAGGAALGLRAAGQVLDAAEREHLAAVLGGGDVADRLAAGADDGALGAEVAVGVDLHLGAAVAEDRLGDDGDDVGALDLAGDDERGGLVVGVGGAGADAGDEAAGGRAISPSQSPAGRARRRRRRRGCGRGRSAGRSGRCGRRRCRSGRRRRSGRGRCSTSPGRRRSGSCPARSSRARGGGAFGANLHFVQVPPAGVFGPRRWSGRRGGAGARVMAGAPRRGSPRARGGGGRGGG